MKSIAILLGLCLSINSFSFDLETTPVLKVEKYTRDQQNSIKLQTPFAKPLLITPELVQQIKGKKIHRIELVYTSYKESPDFDQQLLNKKRIEELSEKLPQILTDNPTWSFIEQTGAKKRSEAKVYYHGFVIHFGNQTSYRSLQTFFEEAGLSKEFTSYAVSNDQDVTLKMESGTTIHIAAGSVKTKSGTTVQGDYTLKYRDFRNQSEIVLSGIPMQITEEGSTSNFESFGMYEVRGEQNGEELELQTPITVDFNTTAVGPNVNFFSLDDQTGTWKEEAPIVYPEVKEFVIPKGKNWFWGAQNANGDVLIDFNPENYDEVLDTLQTDPFWSTVKYIEKRRFNGFIIPTENHHEFLDFLHTCVNPRLSPKYKITRKLNNDGSTSMVQGANILRVETPTLIKGVKSRKFGVFNCDSRSKFKKPVEINPIYVNEEGTLIDEQLTACLIDRKINGSISYHPNAVTCDIYGENIILLFTSDGKIFLHEAPELSEEKDYEITNPIFDMEEITAQIKNPKDLKKLLKL